MSSPDAARAAVETVVRDGGDADDVLRRVVATLRDQGGYAWVGIYLLEEGELTLGPAAGEPDAPKRLTVPVLWQDERIAELAVDGAPEGDRRLLEHVASLVSGHCLVGWDTGGEPWES